MLQSVVVGTSVTTQDLKANSGQIGLCRSLSLFHYVEAVFDISNNTTNSVTAIFTPVCGQTSSIPKGAVLNGLFTVFTSTSMVCTPDASALVSLGTVPLGPSLDNLIYNLFLFQEYA